MNGKDNMVADMIAISGSIDLVFWQEHSLKVGMPLKFYAH